MCQATGDVSGHWRCVRPLEMCQATGSVVETDKSVSI